MIVLFNWVLFMFHVNFQGCNIQLVPLRLQKSLLDVDWWDLIWLQAFAVDKNPCSSMGLILLKVVLFHLLTHTFLHKVGHGPAMSQEPREY